MSRLLNRRRVPHPRHCRLLNYRRSQHQPLSRLEPAITPTANVAELPSCASPAPLTLAQTEGPYYTPNSPERASLIEPGMGGTKLIVTGYVLTTDCQPIANAWLDFWQADDQGAYDNAGYRLRGHLFTDETGALHVGNDRAR